MCIETVELSKKYEYQKSLSKRLMESIFGNPTRNTRLNNRVVIARGYTPSPQNIVRQPLILSSSKVAINATNRVLPGRPPPWARADVIASIVSGSA